MSIFDFGFLAARNHAPLFRQIFIPSLMLALFGSAPHAVADEASGQLAALLGAGCRHADAQLRRIASRARLGRPEPVTHYELPGDCVLGPFQGDWYDAVRIYRRWAVTAPWCAKGPMIQRDAYAKWFLNIDYRAMGRMGDHQDQQRKFIKRDRFDFPITVTHDYGHFNGWTIHDASPEYFPPTPGSVNYRQVVGELRDRGARVLP